ncbi:hypothetical protein JCM8547_009325 [Rhodosporidiobolus lusitaniae]
MADLQAYLAAKYMTGAKADAILERADGEGKRRRKKRKVEAAAPVASGSGGGLMIADQDGAWGAKEEEEEEFKPVVEERRGEFKAKAKSASWATIRDADPALRPRAPTPEPEDEAPYVVSTTVDAAPAPRGGLQSAADLRAEQERKAAEQERKRLKAIKEEERRKAEARERGEEDEDPNATVYRDASGRKINVKLAKAEKAKAERDRIEKEMAKMEWGKGLIQKEDKEKAKREAEALKRKGMSRFADDEDMNEELKEVERWNDPAAAFLTKKTEKKSTKPKFPTYQGPTPPPNRFGIKPGYRWDGVDRGNGWEAKLMQKRNSRAMNSSAMAAWSMEDM